LISNTVTSLRIVLLAPLYLLLTTGQGETARWAALAVFLAAGFTDVVDGFLARRLNEVSAFGAMLDLIADRLLTVITMLALIVGGTLGGWGALAGVVLVARDLIVASLNEACPGRLAIRVSPLERVKITFQIVGFAVLIAPEFWRPTAQLSQHGLGAVLLGISAALALVTLADYSGRALKALRA
jgi:CDP-diacylglycerol--glycerol-3-phosphate 3-phosphatidyltransferase